MAFDYSSAVPDADGIPEYQWDGPMRVDFSSTASEVTARFTYVEGLIIRAFSSLDVQLAMVSRAGDNLATPHESLTLADALGQISYVTFESQHLPTGDRLSDGGLFLLDDLDVTAATTTPDPVPEPSTLILVASAGLLIRKKLRVRSRSVARLHT
jgi:hypothetical protein